MQGFFDLRMAPVCEWDAVICTSQAVLSSVSYQMDLIDSHMRSHLRVNPPPRPMLPVIPLGVHCDDFTPDAAKGAALRKRIGAGAKEVVFVTIARLTPHEKFDPLPIYIAMQNASKQLAKGQKLHVVMCGVFRDDYSRTVFEKGAASLMPDVGFAILDGADADERKAALSGADVFMFLIDNIQETFGLAPLEGMAAGLPLLVSDWDGMRDTVTADVGFRVTTRSLGPQHLTQEALRYQGGIDNYVQYCASTSAMTEIDMGELTARILELARNPALRKRMGDAGARHVRAQYDWSKIVPQMQDLWAEQDVRRRLGIGKSVRYPGDALPISPSPTALFAGYPTEKTSFGEATLVANDLAGGATVAEVLAVRNYQGLKRIFASPEHIERIQHFIAGAGPQGTSLAHVEAATGIKGIAAERIVIWLMKYAFIRRN
jgi:glycosyltransferase involved in cell wall biosynthesis